MLSDAQTCSQGSCPPQTCFVKGCWANPQQGVLRILAQNATAALETYGVHNMSDIGNLSCTSRCSDRCYPGDFVYAPCTPSSDLKCADPKTTQFGVSNVYSSPRWPVALDDGTIFYCDGHAIFRTDGRPSTEDIAAQVYAGNPLLGTFVDHHRDPLIARFKSPGGMVWRDGCLYIADTGNAAVRVLNTSNGSVMTLLGGPGNVLNARMDAPLDLSWGPDSMLYIIDPPAFVIYRYSVTGNVVSVYAGVKGEYGIGRGPLSTVRFWELTSIVVVGEKIYVTEYTQCTLRSIDIASRVVTTVAGQSNVCDSACTSSIIGTVAQNDNQQGMLAKLCRPSVVRRWGLDVLYVGENFNNIFKNVRSINITTTSVTSLTDDPRWRDSPLVFASPSDQQFVFRSNLQTNVTYIQPIPCQPQLATNTSLYDCSIAKNLTTADHCPGLLRVTHVTCYACYVLRMLRVCYRVDWEI